MEETPALDTYGSRKKARMVIGGLAVGFLLLAGFLIVQRFSPSESDSNRDDFRHSRSRRRVPARPSTRRASSKRPAICTTRRVRSR